MKKKLLLEKIKTKYILENIFHYIEDDDFKLRLFFYSKSFQNKLELKLIDFQRVYFRKFDINLDDYLYNPNYFPSKNFDKNILNKKFKKDLSSIKKEFNNKVIEEIILKEYNYPFQLFQEKKEEENDEMGILLEKPIEIYSPLFELLSKNNYLEKNFTVPIPLNTIKKYNTKNDYISAFDKMNKLNLKYPSIFVSYNKYNDIDLLKELMINFKNIKRLNLIQNEEEEDDDDDDNNNYEENSDILYNEYNEENDYEDEDSEEEKEEIDEKGKKELDNKNYDYILKTLFSFDNHENKLVQLELGIKENYKIKSNIMDNLNNFSSLENLHLTCFEFRNTFELNLNNLQILQLDECKNISISEKTCLNIRKLFLCECSIIRPKKLLEFHNLKEINLTNLKKQKYCLIIDFTKLKNLKFFTGENCDFINLESESLEKVILEANIDKSYTTEKKMIEKLISIKSLKEIAIELWNIKDINLKNIKGKNSNVQDLEIIFKNKVDYSLISLLTKFPNLTDLEIILPYKPDILGFSRNANPFFQIKENAKSKITSFSFYSNKFFNNKIKFYIQSYEKLKAVNLFLDDSLKKLKNSFPAFSDKCSVIFNSLETFNFRYDYGNEIDLDILNNFYKNIDYMPNLKNFYFICNKNIGKEFYIKLIKKILSLNLSNVNIELLGNESKGTFSKKELKKINQEINFNRFNRIHIQKF